MQTPPKCQKTQPDASPPPTMTPNYGSPPTTVDGPSFSPISPPSTVEMKEDGSVPTTGGNPSRNLKGEICSLKRIRIRLDFGKKPVRNLKRKNGP